MIVLIFSIALVNKASAERQRRFFNNIFKSDSSFFKLKKQPTYSSQDEWKCADGRSVLIKDILKGNVRISIPIKLFQSRPVCCKSWNVSVVFEIETTWRKTQNKWRRFQSISCNALRLLSIKSNMSRQKWYELCFQAWWLLNSRIPTRIWWYGCSMVSYNKYIQQQ